MDFILEQGRTLGAHPIFNSSGIDPTLPSYRLPLLKIKRGETLRGAII